MIIFILTIIDKDSLLKDEWNEQKFLSIKFNETISFFLDKTVNCINSEAKNFRVLRGIAKLSKSEIEEKS